MCCACDACFWFLVFTCCGCMDTEREQLQPQPPLPLPLPPLEVKKVSANPFSLTGLPKDSHLNSVAN